METRTDFLQWLQFDMVLKILMSLDDPCDLIRASVLSRCWHHFVIANGLCKQLCLRLFPQISSVAYVTEPGCGTKESAHVGSSNSVELETFEREHRFYAFLVHALTTFTASDCVAGAISASSTDNYPKESIRNTLNPGNRVLRRASYWSSKGQRDPAVPETLIYKLIADVCVITEISVQPFQAYFQSGEPIYSAKSVRFRMGHPRSPTVIPNDLRDLPLQLPADDKFIWTYTSQEFSMAQENSLQKFKLPEPVLCIGGCLQIELLGRVQKNEMDGLYYICIAHVEALGQSLFPAFDVEVLEPSGKFALKYYPEVPPVLPYSQHADSPNLSQENLWDLERNELYNGDDDDNDRDLFFIQYWNQQ